MDFWLKQQEVSFARRLEPFHRYFLSANGLEYQRKRTMRGACGVYAAGFTSQRVCRDQMKGVSGDATNRSANARAKKKKRGRRFKNNFPFLTKLSREACGGEWRRTSCLMSLLRYYARLRGAPDSTEDPQVDARRQARLELWADVTH